MKNEPVPGRLLEQLPAIYRAEGSDSDLALLLAAFEELLFIDPQESPDRASSVENRLLQLPALLAPLGLASGPGAAASSSTPRHFLPWLATWFAFSPHNFVAPDRLRHVIAGIVPLYGRRGTREYLQSLLGLCFDEIVSVRVDDSDFGGLRIGVSRLGSDSMLIEERPFCFRVVVEGRVPLAEAAAMRFEQKLRAVIDFAKPAHTAYELQLRHTDVR
jgi:phage tail-like protein